MFISWPSICLFVCLFVLWSSDIRRPEELSLLRPLEEKKKKKKEKDSAEEDLYDLVEVPLASGRQLQLLVLYVYSSYNTAMVHT